MDVRLSAEQRALRDSAAQMVDRLGPKAVAELDDADRRARLETALAATGWRELRCADEDGAPFASTVEVALVAEELGRGLADAPFIGPTLAAELRRLAGIGAARDLETVVLSNALNDLAIDHHPGIAFDASAVGSGLCFFHGVLGSTPIPAGAGRSPDLTRQIHPMVPAPTEIGGTFLDDVLDRWHAFGIAISCADLVGIMRGTIELARSYACTRQQYGAHIGSFQAVQHLLADAHVALEGSRSTALHAAWAVDHLPNGEALAAAAGAKAYCARAAMAVCETSIQVHGGIGNTWECLAHVYLRRAIVSADLHGNVGASLQRVLEHRLGAA